MSTQITIRTSLLYGVYVSAKSYYIGLRCLVKRGHARMLASRVAGDKLPPELVDWIADYLYASESRTVRSNWKKGATIDHNQNKFALDSNKLTPAEALVLDLTDPCKTGVDAIVIDSSKPSQTNGCILKQRPSHYVHLSCTGIKPSIAMSLPGGSAVTISNSSSATPITYSGAKSNMQATCTSNRYWHAPDAAGSVGHDQLAYKSKNGMTSAERHKSPHRQVSRLLQGCDIEEAIKNWDDEAIRKFVKLLDLHVVPFDGGDGLTPGLHIWQRVSEF